MFVEMCLVCLPTCKTSTSVGIVESSCLPVPFWQSGRAKLGNELYRVLTSGPSSPEEMLKSLNLKSEHHALDSINKLEAAVVAWREKITGQVNGKSPMRTSWSFVKDPISDLDKTESLVYRVETLIQHLKSKYPNLPHTFLDATKIRYGKVSLIPGISSFLSSDKVIFSGKWRIASYRSWNRSLQDVGHAILEAYSRVLGNVAFSILSRIRDILQEDALSNPNSPAVSCCFPGAKCSDFLESPGISKARVRHSLIDQMNMADRRFKDSFTNFTSDSETSSSEPKTSSVATTPSSSRVWCIRKEAYVGVTPTSSPWWVTICLCTVYDLCIMRYGSNFGFALHQRVLHLSIIILTKI